MRMWLLTLITEICNLDPRLNCLVFESPYANLVELDAVAAVKRVILKGVPKQRSARVAYENTLYPVALRAGNVDVTLGTHNVMPAGSPRPFVLVLQSLQYLFQPASYGLLRGIYLRAAVKLSLRRATTVICVSEAARKDAIAWTGLNPERFVVAHHGISPDTMDAARTTKLAHSGMPPYILTVMTMYRYKNFHRLIEAYARLRAKHHVPHRLRLVGGEADVTTDELRQYARRQGVEDMVDFVGPVPHKAIAAHYRGADLFVFPSLYETFGFPPLEAMAFGCPVVAANGSSIPEIVGSAAELVDPMDPEAMTRGLERALLDQRRRHELIDLGRRRVAQFSWRACAERYLAVIQDAIASTQTPRARS